MGYDQDQQSNSSGTLATVIGFGLFLAILAILAVGGAAFLWVRASTEQAQAVAMQERVLAEKMRAEAMERMESASAEFAPTQSPMLNFELNLDRDGKTNVVGAQIDLNELRLRLAKLKDQTSNAFSVHIHADPDCPVKHLLAIQEVLNEMGDIKFRVTLTED